MAVKNGPVAARAASGSGKLRPQPHRQFRLMPVPLRDAPEWNAAIARWAAA